MLKKSFWEGNKWPSVDIEAYEYDDFIKIITHLAVQLKFRPPEIADILDGYVADFYVNGINATSLMDNWTFQWTELAVILSIGKVYD